MLRIADELELGAVKRLCLEFTADNFEAAVATRNRAVVEELSSIPYLLAEVVSLSSSELAREAIEALPACPRRRMEPGSDSFMCSLAI